MNNNNSSFSDKKLLVSVGGEDDYEVTASVNASSSLSSSSDSSESSTSNESHGDKTRYSLCRIPASPWPVFVTVVLFFTAVAINLVTIESVLYNKLCYQHFHNLTLCSNKTFTASHPDLQVCTSKRNLYIPTHWLILTWNNTLCDPLVSGIFTKGQTTPSNQVARYALDIDHQIRSDILHSCDFWCTNVNIWYQCGRRSAHKHKHLSHPIVRSSLSRLQSLNTVWCKKI